MNRSRRLSRCLSRPVACSVLLLIAALYAPMATNSLAGESELAREDSVSLSAFIASQPQDLAEPPEPDRAEPQPPETPPEPAPQPVPFVDEELAFLDEEDFLAPEPILFASVPNMFGDLVGPGLQVVIPGKSGSQADTVASFPGFGNGGRAKVVENNNARPQHRVYLSYNRYHNALDAVVPTDLVAGGKTRVSDSLDRYLIGVERTFACGLWSLDFRLPIITPSSFATVPAPAGQLRSVVESNTNSIGNLSIVWKRLLHGSERSVVSAGVDVNLPTGSDVTGQFAPLSFGLVIPSQFRIENNAVHLAPFLASHHHLSERLFLQNFLTVDIPTSGNNVEIVEFGAGTFSGEITDQTLLMVDVEAGYWLYRDPCCCRPTGLASIVELHYTTSLEDADPVVRSATAGDFIGNAFNRFDILNLTVGLHARIGKSTLRVAGAFPLRDDEEQLFDSEIIIQFNRYF